MIIMHYKYKLYETLFFITVSDKTDLLITTKALSKVYTTSGTKQTYRKRSYICIRQHIRVLLTSCNIFWSCSDATTLTNLRPNLRQI